MHGDRYDYSLVQYARMHAPVQIICVEHGVFKPTPANHLAGKHCARCAGTKKLTTTDFIARAEKVHGNRYDYLLVSYTTSRFNVKIVCSEHGVFEQTPENHLAGKGCIQCWDERRSEAKRGTTSSFITKAREVHGDRYDYSLVEYRSGRDKVKIVCEKHGIFEQEATSHLQGSGCRPCSVAAERNSLESVVAQFKEVHGGRYDYSLVAYISGRSNVEILCQEHGIFEQMPDCHIAGAGCPICYREEHLFTSEGFIQRARAVHGDRYDYSLVEYKNAQTKLSIVCKKHGVFQQVPDSHLRGHGCRKCNISRGEAEVADWLACQGILYVREWEDHNCRPRDRITRFDFYLSEHNTIIEYDGKQHFEPVCFGGISLKQAEANLKNTQHTDLVKNAWVREQGIHMIRIQYDDDIDTRLTSELGNAGGLNVR